MENTGTWMSPDILAIPPDPRLPVSDADAREEWAIDAAMALAAAGDAEPAVCGRPIDAAIVAPCEKPAGHAGPCRAFSLETGNSF
jgi:hypothetical protein